MKRKSQSACPRGYKADGTDAADLLKALGPRSYRKLQDAFGGRRIWVPKPGRSQRCGTCDWRDDCVGYWRAEGRPIDSIAGRLGLSPKSVYRILERDMGPHHQY